MRARRSGRRLSMEDRARNRGTAVRRNYLELEARNRSLGRAGEELVLEFEHQRLWRTGKRELADRIEHVAQTQGDGPGFDIHSFELDGRDRLIEVKPTRLGALTPFFASRNEVEVSDERAGRRALLPSRREIFPCCRVGRGAPAPRNSPPRERVPRAPFLCHDRPGSAAPLDGIRMENRRSAQINTNLAGTPPSGSVGHRSA
jgi:Domain of unknown function (DUF3883)